MPRVGLVTLGCAKNLVDSEVMLGLLAEAGFRLEPEPNRADLVIVNTCGFIDEAKQESIAAILDVAEACAGRRPRLIVAGCLAQRYPEDLLRDLPEISAVLGTGEIESIVGVAERVMAGERLTLYGHAAARFDRPLPRRRLTAGPSAYLKIAEGCDHACRFCAIPAMRGPFRSRPPEVVLAEAEALVVEGVRELCLVSQDTASYGRDLPGRPSLAILLERLAELPGLRWLRCHYLYPQLVDDALIERFASLRRLVPYFDVPLQHASDKVLRAMGRPERHAATLRLIERLRERVPGAVLRSSFIVGYPGEGPAEFAELLSFLDTAQLDHAGFFAYSPEEGTPGALLPTQVPQKIRDARYHRAMAVQASVARRRNAARIGQTLEVLIERPLGDGYWEGRWYGQAPEVDGQSVVAGEGLAIGDVLAARVVAADDFELHFDARGTTGVAALPEGGRNLT